MSAGGANVQARNLQCCDMLDMVRVLRQEPTCLSLMAADRPAGPAPTMQTSYSMASLGSMLSACADMLRDAAGTCIGYHTHPNRSWAHHLCISGIAEGLEQGVVRPIPLAAAWYMLAERH